MTPADLLLPGRIRACLAARELGARIYYYPETDSTNDVAIALARAGETAGTIVITDYQRRGRGRGGHVWVSPRGSDLTFSLILRPSQEPRAALAISLVLSLSVAIVLSKCLDTTAGVKWPNDVVIGDRKIAGLLVEAASRGAQTEHMVVGVGVNVNTARDAWPAPLRDLTESCVSVSGGGHLDRAVLLADILAVMETYYDRYRADGFAALAASYEERLTLKGRRVAFARERRQMQGIVEGVAADGALRVRIETGETLLLYGESVVALS